MAASFSSSMLIHSALNLCAILLIICPLSLYASPKAIDISSKCPNVLTTTSIKKKPPPNDTFLVVVPWKVGFEQFVKFNPDTCLIDGFSVQVFLQALRRMHPHPLHYKFVLHGSGSETPLYDDMIDMVANREADAVVADVTITKDRMEKVAFSMPYLASTLVMVTPFRYGSAGTLWDFLKPFSWPLWITLLACFVATGCALYLLENKNPDFSITAKKHQISNDAPSSSHGSSTPASAIAHDPSAPAHDPSAPAFQFTPAPTDYPPLDPSSLQRPGPPIYQASHKRRILNAYWFTSLCVFAAQQESVRTHLGRFVTVVWLFVMLIFNSSYTASLASLLSAQKRYPTIEGFQALTQDNNISVGYQEGSFMKNFMTKYIDVHRLRNFASESDFAKALRKGNLQPDGVGAVLDELPYIRILLQSECFLTKSSVDDDHLASFGGFGFAFQNNSPHTEEISKMIVAMEEDGTLKRLQKGWGIGEGENRGRCSSNEDASHLRLKSFGGLFSILCGVYVFCIGWRFLIKASQSGAGNCSCIALAYGQGGCNICRGALTYARGGCNICRGASLSRRSSKVSDGSFERDDSS